MTAKDIPRASVIIANWNGEGYLEACLRSIYSQSFSDLEVIIVDNASTDGSRDLIRQKFPQASLHVNQKNLGFAAANNIGIRLARGDHAAFVNNDVVLDPEWLGILIERLEKDRLVAGACGEVYSLEEPERRIFTLPKVGCWTGHAFWINGASGECKVDYLSGNSMILKRSVLEEVGPWDTGYEAYYEETDLCARIIRSGYDLLFVPQARAWHKQFGSSDLNTVYFLMLRNQVRFVLKNFDRLFLLMACLTLPASLAYRGFQNLKERDRQKLRSVYRSVMWNLGHLPQTLDARSRDLGRSNGRRRSYNRSLPLRQIRVHPGGTYSWR